MLKNRQTLLFIGDIVVLAISFCLMTALRFDLHTDAAVILAQAHLFALLFVLWLLIFFIFELYNIRRINPNPRNIGLLAAAIILNVFLSIVYIYVLPQNGITPKTNLILVAVFAFVFLALWRRFFYLLFTNTFTRTIILVGTHPLFADLAAEFDKHKHLGTVVRFDDHSFDRTALEKKRILFITESAEPKILLQLLRKQGAEALSLSEAYKTLFGKIPVELVTDEKAIEMITGQPHLGIAYLYRAVEVVIAVLVLIISSPLLVLAMLAIMLEDGTPALYTQSRVGKNGAVFSIYKLRSMKKGAESLGPQWASSNDTRITTVGRVIRTLHIDEIPQMWNIIKGDIALIGPRPERPELVAELEQQIPYYFLRHSIKPGFTGWAQIKFRYARTVSDSREKFAYDLYYLSNKNVLLDFGILLKTVQIIFTH